SGPAQKNALGKQAVETYLNDASTRTVLTNLAGQNDSLPRFDSQRGIALEGRAIPVHRTGSQLFNRSTSDGPFTVFVAEVTSVDALSTRLNLDLRHLQNGE